jgi:hypothetical protein
MKFARRREAKEAQDAHRKGIGEYGCADKLIDSHAVDPADDM